MIGSRRGGGGGGAGCCKSEVTAPVCSQLCIVAGNGSK